MEGSSSNEEGKNIAIISYITPIGLIVAIIMNNNKKNDFARYHIRQSLGIMILYFAVWVMFSIISTIIYIPLLSTILYLALFVLWILGAISAVQGEKKAVPVIGEHFQNWVKNVG